MKTRPTDKKRKDAYCSHYCDYRHDTEDYFQLKDEKERLISKGRLRWYLAKDQLAEEFKGQSESRHDNF